MNECKHNNTGGCQLCVEELEAQVEDQSLCIHNLIQEIESLKRSKFTVGRIEARYPWFNKVLEVIEIVQTPGGLHIIVNP